MNILLANLRGVPEGTPRQEVERAAILFDVTPEMMKAFCTIESGCRPHLRTGSYKGCFQLSEFEFRKYGDGNIYNCRDNAIAAAHKFKTEAVIWRHVYGTEPDLLIRYLIHQQGFAGAEQHLKAPDRIAYQSMCATEEGKRKGVKWCKRAIWGNVPYHFKPRLCT